MPELLSPGFREADGIGTGRIEEQLFAHVISARSFGPNVCSFKLLAFNVNQLSSAPPTARAVNDDGQSFCRLPVSAMKRRSSLPRRRWLRLHRLRAIARCRRSRKIGRAADQRVLGFCNAGLEADAGRAQHRTRHRPPISRSSSTIRPTRPAYGDLLPNCKASGRHPQDDLIPQFGLIRDDARLPRTTLHRDGRFRGRRPDRHARQRAEAEHRHHCRRVQCSSFARTCCCRRR